MLYGLSFFLYRHRVRHSTRREPKKFTGEEDSGRSSLRKGNPRSNRFDGLQRMSEKTVMFVGDSIRGCGEAEGAGTMAARSRASSKM
ncbi:hypothetical protein LINPERHAP1_LOCUS29935 [Linum perenne]